MDPWKGLEQCLARGDGHGCAGWHLADIVSAAPPRCRLSRLVVHVIGYILDLDSTYIFKLLYDLASQKEGRDKSKMKPILRGVRKHVSRVPASCYKTTTPLTEGL